MNLNCTAAFMPELMLQFAYESLAKRACRGVAYVALQSTEHMCAALCGPAYQSMMEAGVRRQQHPACPVLALRASADSHSRYKGVSERDFPS